jgi:hypothetical protein
MACESWQALSPAVRPPSTGTPPEEEPEPDDEAEDPDDADVPDDPDEELEPEPDDDDPGDVPPDDDDPDPDDDAPDDDAPDEEALPDEPELDVPPASPTSHPCPLSVHAATSGIATKNRTPPRMPRTVASHVTARETGLHSVLERASVFGRGLAPTGARTLPLNSSDLWR